MKNPLKEHILWLVNQRKYMDSETLLTYNFSMYNWAITGEPIACILDLLESDELKIITFLLPDGRTTGFIFPANTTILDLENWHDKSTMC